MGQQVVGLFQREESVVEAAQLLHAAGCTPKDVDLVSTRDVGEPELSGLVREVRLGRLMETPEGTWPCALRGALVGSLVVEVPVLIGVFLAFDSWAMQLFLGSTLWKIGALFGGLLGAVVGSHRGLESTVAHRYHQHLLRGAFVLVARVSHRDAPQARGIIIESGAFDIRNVEGNFIAKEPPSDKKRIPEPRDSFRSRRLDR